MPRPKPLRIEFTPQWLKAHYPLPDDGSEQSGPLPMGHLRKRAIEQQQQRIVDELFALYAWYNERPGRRNSDTALLPLFAAKTIKILRFVTCFPPHAKMNYPSLDDDHTAQERALIEANDPLLDGMPQQQTDLVKNHIALSAHQESVTQIVVLQVDSQPDQHVIAIGREHMNIHHESLQNSIHRASLLSEPAIKPEGSFTNLSFSQPGSLKTIPKPAQLTPPMRRHGNQMLRSFNWYFNASRFLTHAFRLYTTIQRREGLNPQNTLEINEQYQAVLRAFFKTQKVKKLEKLARKVSSADGAPIDLIQALYTLKYSPKQFPRNRFLLKSGFARNQVFGLEAGKAVDIEALFSNQFTQSANCATLFMQTLFEALQQKAPALNQKNYAQTQEKNHKAITRLTRLQIRKTDVDTIFSRHDAMQNRYAPSPPRFAAAQYG